MERRFLQLKKKSYRLSGNSDYKPRDGRSAVALKCSLFGGSSWTVARWNRSYRKVHCVDAPITRWGSWLLQRGSNEVTKMMGRLSGARLRCWQDALGLVVFNNPKRSKHSSAYRQVGQTPVTQQKTPNSEMRDDNSRILCACLAERPVQSNLLTTHLTYGTKCIPRSQLNQ